MLRLNELTGEQKSSAEEVHELLRGYIDRPAGSEHTNRGPRRFLPAIDRERWNQNILLDGSRGSGKTSLLVTVLDLWNATFARRAAPGDELDQEYASRAADLDAKRKAWRIEPQSWPVVPLEIVDLQPLPAHTPVLLHLAEPLARVIEAIEEKEEPGEAAPAWLGLEPHGLKSRKAWDDLVRAIVAGWDDASADRWNRLDPENAEFEINRAVRSHQSLVTCFHGFVDFLIADFRRWRPGAQRPLFVLPVDDADMNSERAEELLEALRMLSHPRLVFLLTGDSDLFYRIAEERVARRLRSPRGRTSDRDASPVRDEFAVGLGHRIYDKIIPPPHRCLIPPVEVGERHGHLKKLGALSVNSFLHREHPIPIKEMLSEAMVGHGLPGHIRVLKDLELFVERRAAVSASDALARGALRIWLEAIEDHPTDLYLPSYLTSLVRMARRVPDEATDPPSEAEVYALTVEALEPRPTTLDGGVWLESVPAQKLGAHELTLQRRGSLNLRGLWQKDGKEVPPGLLGALILADMIAFEHGIPRGLETQSSSHGFGPIFARVLYQLSNEQDPLTIGWPLPGGRTLLDLSLVNFRWQRVPSTPAPGADEMARWFLAVVAQLATMYDANIAPLPVTPSGEAPVPPWDEVARRVVSVAKLGGDLSQRQLNLRAWARGRAALLATPESGLPLESAQNMLAAFQAVAGEPFWSRMKEQARGSRLDRLRAALEVSNKPVTDSQVEELQKAIDGEAPVHPWVVNPSVAPNEAAPVIPRLLLPQRRVEEVFANAVFRVAKMDREEQGEAFREVVALSGPYAELLGELSRDLDGTRKLQNTEPYALAHLLSKVAARTGFGHLAARFTVPSTRLEFERLPGRFEATAALLRFPSGERAATALEFYEPPRYAVTDDSEHEVSPLLDFLYRIAWDSRESDAQASEGGTPFTQSWCDFICARLPAWNVRVRWPFPPWRTFEHYRRFVRTWKQRLAVASAPRQVSIPAAHIEVALARQYLDEGSSFRNPGSTLGDGLQIDMRELNVNHRVRQCSVEQAPGQSREVVRVAVMQWLRGLALLLAPESRLPELLLKPWSAALRADSRPEVRSPGDFWLSRDDVGVLKTLRLSRMRESIEASNPSLRGQEQEILEAVDRETPPTEWNALLTYLEKISPPA